MVFKAQKQEQGGDAATQIADSGVLEMFEVLLNFLILHTQLAHLTFGARSWSIRRTSYEI